MSRDGSITLQWGDGEHIFRLGIGQLRELQEKVNEPRAKIGAPLIGPVSLYKVMTSGDAWADEVNEVLRLGLIGGGKEPRAAYDLVKRYGFPARPLAESSLHASSILAAALLGVSDEVIEGKDETARAATEATASPSLSSTGPVQ